MIRVQKYQTFDGAIHDTPKAASKHLDRIYGDLLLKMSRELVGANYTATSDYIDSHLSDFLLLDQIKRDMIMTAEDDED